MPVVWDDQDRWPSALEPETAFRWFTGYGTRPGTNWQNEVTIVRPKDPEWSPGLCAPGVSCPALFMVSPEDENGECPEASHVNATRSERGRSDGSASFEPLLQQSRLRCGYIRCPSPVIGKKNR